jgi:hypothetical protein
MAIKLSYLNHTIVIEKSLSWVEFYKFKNYIQKQIFKHLFKGKITVLKFIKPSSSKLYLFNLIQHG